MPGNWRAWIVDRFALQPIQDVVLQRRVPQTPWYYGDGAALVLLLGVQIATGMLMSLTYTPSPDDAYSSVRYLTTQQTLGWFVRGLHYWSAGLMVVVLMWHMLRVILVGGYKSPREGTWLIGVVLLYSVVLLSITGYMLRWDERGIHAFRVAMHTLYRLPVVGHWLVIIAQGGWEITGRTLTRLYSVHVFWLPILTVALVGWHLYLVIHQGVTSPAERKQPIHSTAHQRQVYQQSAESPRHGEDFHPHTSAKSGIFALVVLALALLLTGVLGPAPLQDEANLTQPAQPAEEWWMWWYSGLLALLPARVAPVMHVLIPAGVFIILVLLPFVDRSPHRGLRKRPVAVAIVVIVVLAVLYLTDFRRRSPFTAWPDPTLPPMPTGVVREPALQQGRQLFVQFGCNTCHPVAGHGPQVGTDLATLRDRYSQAELRSYILQPPAGVPMPSYYNRLTDQQLDRIVDYVLATQTMPFEQR